MSVRIENVTRKFGSQLALDGIHLEVPGAQVLGLLGPNGAGKSTLMRLIAGYLPPTTGRVEVCGHSVETESMSVRRLVGYLPEHNPIHLDMYVREYLAYAAGLHGLSDVDDRVSRIIQRVGLTPESHKLIGQLSKGYRQRVGLAQALIHDPKVLILDEPTSGLDPLQLVEIRELIRGLGSDRTVILSTHIMQEVEAMCNRVILINRGKLVADDDASSFAARPGGLEAAFRKLSAPMA